MTTRNTRTKAGGASASKAATKVTPARTPGRAKRFMSDELFGELLEGVRAAKAVMRGEDVPGVRVSEVAPDAPAPARRAPRASPTAAPDVAAIRGRLRLTQGEFATLLGVSRRTYEGWEQGRRSPTGAARALLRVADRSPEAVLAALR